MKVLIVAKTRQGSGACIGGISPDGKSVRLVSPDPDDERWGLDFEVGDVWEIDGGAPARIIPPHVENVEVRSRRRIRQIADPAPTIERYMPPKYGSPAVLYEGLVQRSTTGFLYVAERNGVPPYSTMFWRPDRPLSRDTSGKRIHYRYPGPVIDSSLVFVGFQEPVEEIPAGTLLRVSLAHWWRPDDRPEKELRCHVQLSGWFASSLETGKTVPAGAVPMVQLDEARALLASVFGYHEFRPLQEQIIGNILAGRDTLAVMPTGAGKSLCYQLPALVRQGLTVVVSPLLSLMQDQVDQLTALGIEAVTLNSTLSYQRYTGNADRVRSGHAKLLYVAPETLLRPETRVLLEDSRVSLIAVDEAHCISEWGHDFRPEYRQMGPVRKHFPSAVCLALTATATERVRNDISSSLGIAASDTYVAGFDRPNLFLEVRRRDSGFGQVLEFVRGRPEEPGIVYCSTREQVEQVTRALTGAGIDARPYHAGLPDAVRAQNQRMFQRDDARVIVATIAFGMGINKPNVRFVLHQSLPDCLETYYQQVGRAGRDGLPSHCLLLYSSGDAGTYQHWIQQGSPAQAAGRTARLQAMVRYAGSTRCRRATLLPYFGDPASEAPCGLCDNCVSEASGRQMADVSADARLFLEAVLQTRQRFGRNHVLDVLRGSRAERVVRWRHDQLAIHGEGRNHSLEQWRYLADCFLDLALVEAEMEHGTLRLTASGRAALDGAPVMIPLADSPQAAPSARTDAHDPALFEELRRVRKEMADDAGVPPYVIFADRTLLEMASLRPITREALLQVHGVGQHKADVYGDPFLEAIRESAPETGGATAAAPSLLGSEGRRFREVGEAFRAGASVEELQARWGVTRETIVAHLNTYARSGGTLEADRVLAECRLPEEVRQKALRTMEELGHARLSPVRDAVGGDVPYLELHLLRLYRTSLS